MDLGTDRTKAEISSLDSSPQMWEPTCARADRFGKEKGSVGRQFPGTEVAGDGVAVPSSAHSCSSLGGWGAGREL